MWTKNLSDVRWTHCGNHFTIYVNQTMVLFALHLYSGLCQLLLSKNGNKVSVRGSGFGQQSLQHWRLGTDSGFKIRPGKRPAQLSHWDWSFCHLLHLIRAQFPHIWNGVRKVLTSWGFVRIKSDNSKKKNPIQCLNTKYSINAKCAANRASVSLPNTFNTKFNTFRI